MKQKQAVLWKYFAAFSGVTLYSATPVTGDLRLVVRGVGREVVLAQRHGDLELIGREGPGQAGVDVGIEPDADRLPLPPGAAAAPIFGVPPYPVAWQNARYSGIAANDSPTMPIATR